MLVRKKSHVRPKTANRHKGGKIMLSRRVLLSKTNVVFFLNASYILLSLTRYFLLSVLFGPWSNVSNPTFSAFVHVLSLMKHPHISLSYSPLHLWPPLCTFSHPVRPRYSSPFPSNFVLPGDSTQ